MYIEETVYVNNVILMSLNQNAIFTKLSKYYDIRKKYSHSKYFLALIE